MDDAARALLDESMTEWPTLRQMTLYVGPLAGGPNPVSFSRCKAALPSAISTRFYGTVRKSSLLKV